MGKESDIQWTDASVNFWTGCKKVSAGCKYCYMYRMKERFKQVPTNILRTKDKTFYAALKWEEPRMIFTCSLSDFFIEEADEWREEAWKVIKDTPQHTWQILTKRPERIRECLPKDWGDGYDNVWLGVTVEDNSSLKRITKLQLIPAKTRFVSFEPLLEQINDVGKFVNYSGNQSIHWAIVGGESGNETGKYIYRPSQANWFLELMHNLSNNNVPVFFKQFGTYLAKKNGMKDRHGGDESEFPIAFQGMRGYPKTYSKNG